MYACVYPSVDRSNEYDVTAKIIFFFASSFASVVKELIKVNPQIRTIFLRRGQLCPVQVYSSKFNIR
jgi:hypothetical protein